MTAAPQFSEDRRQIVHMAMGGFALLLRFIPFWFALGLAAAALGFNLFLLRHVGGARLFRPTERTRGVTTGIVLYPIGVLLLIFMFPDRPDIAAGAWGVLAFGDGAATLVGRRIGGTRVPWNQEKSIAGSMAFVIAGGAGGSFLAWWCGPAIVPPTYAWFPFVAGVTAAVAAAAVETLPIRLDDNISVPATAAGVFWTISLVSEDLLAAVPGVIGSSLPWALLTNAIVATIGYRAGTVSLSGTVAGAIIGTIIFVCAGWQGWVLLFATFAVATLATRVGLHRKRRLGIAEERGGRRGAGNAIANTGVAALAAVMSILTYADATALVAFVAALAAGGSDTVASEIGKAWGRRTFLITPLRMAPPGTSGAMSLEGTIAGLIAAVGLGGLGVGLGLADAAALPAIVAGATIGALAESIMGATLEGPGILNNDVLNFLNTAIGALATIWLLGAAA